MAAAFSKSKGILRYFADFRGGDSGSLALRAPRKVHHIYTREVVLCIQNCLKRAFRGKFIGGGGQMRAQDKKVNCIWAASTATAAANVTNTSFKSSTVPLQTTLLACEPSERKRKEMAMVLVSCSRFY